MKWTQAGLDGIAKLAAEGRVDGLGPKSGPAEEIDEKTFQAAVIRRAKELGWRHYHTHDSRRSPSGFPDLVLVRCGRLIFAELKRQEGGILTAEQKNWYDDLRDACREVYLWRPADWPQIEEVLR
jgi:hypothetical protein